MSKVAAGWNAAWDTANAPKPKPVPRSRSRFTPERRRIIVLLAARGVEQVEIARRFKIHKCQVWKILHNQRWTRADQEATVEGPSALALLGLGEG